MNKKTLKQSQDSTYFPGDITIDGIVYLRKCAKSPAKYQLQ